MIAPRPANNRCDFVCDRYHRVLLRPGFVGDCARKIHALVTSKPHFKQEFQQALSETWNSTFHLMCSSVALGSAMAQLLVEILADTRAKQGIGTAPDQTQQNTTVIVMLLMMMYLPGNIIQSSRRQMLSSFHFHMVLGL